MLLCFHTDMYAFNQYISRFTGTYLFVFIVDKFVIRKCNIKYWIELNWANETNITSLYKYLELQK